MPQGKLMILDQESRSTERRKVSHRGESLELHDEPEV
jgi:hypothetical protein